MKKIFTVALMLLVGNAMVAQNCSANDSTIMGPGSGNDVFYSLKKAYTSGNGTVKTVSNTNWHLAFSVLGSQFPSNPAVGVAIRVNSPLGENPQAGTTGCVLKVIPGANFSNWHNLDTTGLYALPELVDNDSTWNLSAFTSGYKVSDPFNFIWGNYNMTTHTLTGSKVYVLYNKSQNWYKKVHINSLVYDTIWNFTVSNIDNSDSNFVSINKNSHKNRNFIYYDVLNNTLNDREPDNRDWDLLWTKYKGLVPLGPVKVPYTVTGVLHNLGVTVAQNNGKKCNEVWLGSKTAQPSSIISTIGYDWKTFTGTAYAITDTFVYFVYAKDTNTYKMTMISYTGGAQSKTVISFGATSGIDSKQLSSVNVYPNPVNGVLNVDIDKVVTSIQVYDMFGKAVAFSTDSPSIELSDLNAGVYLLIVTTNEGTFQQKIIKE